MCERRFGAWDDCAEARDVVVLDRVRPAGTLVVIALILAAVACAAVLTLLWFGVSGVLIVNGSIPGSATNLP